MRVAHIVSSFSPLSETFIYNYVVELQRRGHDSRVITFNRINTDERSYDDVVVLQLPSRWSPVRLGLAASRRAGLIDSHTQSELLMRRPMLNKLQYPVPDIIHAQFGPMGVRAAPVARQLNIPLLITFHGYDITSLLQDKYWQQQYERLSQDAGAVIGVSSHICARLHSAGFPAHLIHYVHVGVDISKITWSDPTERYNRKRIRCLHVGRLVQKKSPTTLVRAFAIARRQLQSEVDLHLTIAGDGPLREELMQTIRTEGLDSAVDVLGAVSHARALELMQQAHIYTQHSLTAPNGDQEGQPVSIVEAAASGLPVVSTRHSGIPDTVIDGKTGYLVEEGDIEGMAARIVELARNPQKWSDFGRAGRAHIEANFTLEQQVDKSLALYEQILKQRSS